MKTDAQLRAEIAHNRKLLRERKRQALGLPKRARGKLCRPVDRDEAAKIRRGYTNSRSYVRLDGSEVLYGEDWGKRKAELWARAEGRCERLVNTCLDLGGEKCDLEGHDPDHVKSRWPRRDDRLANLELLCRIHHQLKDSRKIGGRK